MINAFDLDLEIVYAGSEAAQITEVRNRYSQEEPVLFHFYDPSGCSTSSTWCGWSCRPTKRAAPTTRTTSPAVIPEYEVNLIRP